MKYCAHCGAQLLDESVVCTSCGCAAPSKENTLDVPSTGLNILSFLLPLVGLILYIVYHEKAPAKAKAIGKWALIGFVVGIIVNVILLSL